MKKDYRWLAVITGIFVAVLLISNIASTKIVAFGPFTFDGGTLLFPLSYIFGDILTEVYGYSRARTVIWTGFAAALLMAITLAIVSVLPTPGAWEYDQAFRALFGLVPRIVTASVIAYAFGEFLNSFVLAKMKVFTDGKYLWTRTIGSTLVGELADTLIFVVIAFLGTMQPSILVSVIVSNYIFKVGVEVVMTPFTYLSVNGLKNAEHEDYYDRKTNFNPFIIVGSDKKKERKLQEV